jgi:hypothetical protein
MRSMNRRERRDLAKKANKKLESIEVRRKRIEKRLNINNLEKSSILKTWLWGYLIYIKEGYTIAPIQTVSLFFLTVRWDALGIMFLYKMRRFICFTYRPMKGRKESFKIKKLLIYVQ